MIKKKKGLLAKYRKEALVLMIGSSLVLVLLFNLQTPTTKRNISSQTANSSMDAVKKETLQAAKKVEEEQTQQSVLLSQFKRDYAEFTKTKKCLTSQNCSYPDNDPREYSLSVAKDLSLKLKTLQPQLTSNWFRLNSKVKNEVISSISVDDGFVKEQVLDLLLSLSAEEANKYMPLVLEHIVDHHNSELIPKAFEFLQRSTTPENEIQIAKHVAQAIVTGAPHTAQAMSKEITTLISPNTSDIFKEALSSLPKQALETEFLTSALSNFELKQSGG